MPSIVYDTYHNVTKPFVDDVITVDFFDYIYNNRKTNIYNLPKSETGWLNRLFNSDSNFENAIICEKKMYYIDYKNTYVKGIILSDIDKNIYNNENFYPEKFYYIAKIGNQLELRQCKGGKNIDWKYVQQNNKPVDNIFIINKIKKTLLDLKNVVKLGGGNPENQYISRDEKEGYLELANLCLTNIEAKNKFNKFIDTLKSYEDDEEYYTTLNYVLSFLHDNNINFIFSFDFKFPLEDTLHYLEILLKANFPVDVELVNTEKYDLEDDKGDTISRDGFLTDFNASIKPFGLQIGFINTNTDQYVIIIHQIKDKDKVILALRKIGYDYDDDTDFS